MIDPELDGIEHINVYSKGKTRLGQLLSNFADTPFDHPEDGKFQSVEGYWYWLLTEGHFLRDNLRFLTGTDAKFTGRRMTDRYEPSVDENEEFIRKVCLAIESKIKQNSFLSAMVANSVLPFKHYYVYEEKIIVPENHKWVLDKLTELRKELKGEVLF